MAIVRWDPMRTLMRWPNIWEDEDWSHAASPSSSQLDVYETNDAVVVSANVAGVSEDAVSITYEKDVLTISAEATAETSDKKRYYQRATRSYSYRVAVPGNIDSKAEPQAHIDKGVLEVTFTKTPEEKPKKITISPKK